MSGSSSGRGGVGGGANGGVGSAGRPQGSAGRPQGGEGGGASGSANNLSGAAGSGLVAGSTSTAGAGTTGFPTTGLLDDFNRPGPALGINWIGASDDYSVREQRISCQTCFDATLWSAPFGAEQEAFATFVAFEPSAAEINVVLKAQGTAGCELIEVLYSPSESHVRIAYCTEGNYHDLERMTLVLEPGDQFGARSHADGSLEVFVNGKVVANFDVSVFPHASGRIGINGIAGPGGLQWDDFGGGDLK